MKTCKNLFLLFIILAGSFVVAAAEEEEYGMALFIGDLIAFLIGEMVGSCLMDTKCAAFLGPIILYVVIGAIVLTIVLQCCCGYKFDDGDYGSSRRYNRRAAMFGAGIGWGATKSYIG